MVGGERGGRGEISAERRGCKTAEVGGTARGRSIRRGMGALDVDLDNTRVSSGEGEQLDGDADTRIALTDELRLRVCFASRSRISFVDVVMVEVLEGV